MFFQIGGFGLGGNIFLRYGFEGDGVLGWLVAISGSRQDVVEGVTGNDPLKPGLIDCIFIFRHLILLFC